MLEVKLTATLAAPAEQVWGVVGNFNGMPAWHPFVQQSVLEPAAGGIGRRVSIAGGTGEPRELVECLHLYDAADRHFAYTIIAGPAPFKNYIGHFRVQPRGPAHCLFDYWSSFEPADGATDADARERVRSFYAAGLANLISMFGKPADPPDPVP